MENLKVNFSAQLWSAKIDYEGEATVVLKVPASDLAMIICLPTQKELNITAEWK